MLSKSCVYVGRGRSQTGGPPEDAHHSCAHQTIKGRATAGPSIHAEMLWSRSSRWLLGFPIPSFDCRRSLLRCRVPTPPSPVYRAPPVLQAEWNSAADPRRDRRAPPRSPPALRLANCCVVPDLSRGHLCLCSSVCVCRPRSCEAARRTRTDVSKMSCGTPDPVISIHSAEGPSTGRLPSRSRCGAHRSPQCGDRRSL